MEEINADSITQKEEYIKIGYDIIGAAFNVRKIAGRGLRERYYEAALAHEILKKGHDVKRQVIVPALYGGEVVEDAYQADIVVDDKVVIEVKAVGVMTEFECRQLFTYMKLSGFKLGYLINFGANDFKTGRTDEKLPYKYGIYRYVNNL